MEKQCSTSTHKWQHLKASGDKAEGVKKNFVTLENEIVNELERKLKKLYLACSDDFIYFFN